VSWQLKLTAWVSLEEIEGEMTQGCEVLGHVVAFVLAKIDIEHPMRFVLDGPMQANSGSRSTLINTAMSTIRRFVERGDDVFTQ